MNIKQYFLKSKPWPIIIFFIAAIPLSITAILNNDPTPAIATTTLAIIITTIYITKFNRLKNKKTTE